MPTNSARLVRAATVVAALVLLLLLTCVVRHPRVHIIVTEPPEPDWFQVPDASKEQCGAKYEECFGRRAVPQSVYEAQLQTAASRFERQRNLRRQILEGARAPMTAQNFALFPPVLSCPFADRVGHFEDGGKWICEPQLLPADCVVYSVGGSTDLSFELEMHNRFGCRTHTFDPGPGLMQKMQPQLREGMFYHAVALGPITADPAAPDAFDLIIDGVKVPVKTLSGIVAELGTVRVDVLKLDIEASEWGALPQLISEGMLEKLQVKQLQVEFHMPVLKDLDAIVNQLYERDYVLFSNELNWRHSFASELAFVKRSYLLKQAVH